MGYYTEHTLEVIGGEVKIHEFYDFIIEKYGEGIDMYYAVDENGESVDGDGAKWYNHREDMIKYSKHFPESVFVLTGFGEDSGDIWKEYYKNGKFQPAPAKITFDDFDENKLEVSDK